jgi:microcystin-dependent protein
MAAGAVSSWSQTAGSNATADSTVNWAEGMAPSAVNDSARALMASVAKWRDDICGILVSAGTSTAYTITSNQTQTSNTDGFTVQFTPGTTNGGATTLSVDSQTAKPLRFRTGVELPSGTLISGSLYQATYRSATEEWLLHSFDSSIYAVPIGSAIDYFGSTAPNSSFVLAYGQAISRTTYATLFSLFGTTYGTGDGSTTFNIPDLRGRVIAGKDDMGGSAASRLTSTYFGASAASLGAVGGSESHTLTSAQLASHTHANSLNDPGHTHIERADTSAGGVSLRIVGAGGNGDSGSNANTTQSSTTGITITNASAGSGNAHNNTADDYRQQVVEDHLVATEARPAKRE